MFVHSLTLKFRPNNQQKKQPGNRYESATGLRPHEPGQLLAQSLRFVYSVFPMTRAWLARRRAAPHRAGGASRRLRRWAALRAAFGGGRRFAPHSAAGLGVAASARRGACPHDKKACGNAQLRTAVRSHSQACMAMSQCPSCFRPRGLAAAAPGLQVAGVRNRSLEVLNCGGFPLCPPTLHSVTHVVRRIRAGRRHSGLHLQNQSGLPRGRAFLISRSVGARPPPLRGSAPLV